MLRPFDESKVRLTRKPFSVTQGEVLVEYDGTRIEQYGDDIQLRELEGGGVEWRGNGDASYIDAAEREAVLRGLAAPVPDFTGRHGDAAREVSENGNSYLVVERMTADGKTPDGVSIYGPNSFPSGPATPFPRPGVRGFMEKTFGDAWVSFVVMKAWNAEDAFRNFGGASCQQRAFVDGCFDWETIPFVDEDGEFTPEGGDGEYAAYPADEAARDGVTLPDVFSEEVTILPADFADLPRIVAGETNDQEALTIRRSMTNAPA